MDKTFVATQNRSSELHAGRHVLLKNVSAEFPIPEDLLSFLRPSAGPMIDPFVIDIEAQHRERLETEAVFREANAPRPDYRRSDLTTWLRCTDLELNEMMDGWGFPRARLVYEMDGVAQAHRTGKAWEAWQKRPVDEWIARAERLLAGLFAESKKARR